MIPADPSSPQEQHRALYLRWRPRTFSEVVGQEHVTRTLRNAVMRNSIAHGYLLCGPRGTGKTSLARILYKALNCENPRDGEPCLRCASCQAAEAGRALDLIEIDAASNRGIDDIRALRERVRFAPSEARTKVYIVDEAHQLTAPAWDAFLKTLEEPPPHTVFVMATTSAHRIPATIVSRCQRFDLGRIGQTAITSHLEDVARQEGIELEGGVAERLARLARGGMRDALGMLEQVAAFTGSPVTLDAARSVLGLVRGDALRTFIDALAQRDTRHAFEVLEDVAAEGADLRQFLDEVLFDLRAALLVRTGAESATAADFSADERTWLRSVAEHWSPGELATVLQAYADIGGLTVDDQQLLIRLELATARVLEGQRAGAYAAPLQTPPAQASPAVPPPAASAPPSATPAPDMAVAPSDESNRPVPAPPSPVADGDGRAANSMTVPSPAGASRVAPSLAVLQGRWEALLDRYPGNLLEKMLLHKVQPIALDDGLATLGGKLDPREIAKLDAEIRRKLERYLETDFGYPLRVRFIEGSEVPLAEPQEPPAPPSLVDYAATLFGGEVVAAGDVMMDAD